MCVITFITMLFCIVRLILTRQTVFYFSPVLLPITAPPVFVFLAGIAACIYGHNKSRQAVSLYLLKRGLWLVLVELFIITLAWTFNPQYPVFHLQVIWAIGCSMNYFGSNYLYEKGVYFDNSYVINWLS